MALARLVREWASWDRARAEYKNIHIPVLLVYGDDDWSLPRERKADAQAIPGAHVRVIEKAGHFLSLDAPAEVTQLVLDFAASRP
jgi:pimeloyl-ACP methyl ester carboxylesterase